ncbi:MAG: hypothetical protein IH629_00095 [Thermoleophilia bacterium]|nr:hypothetical protein [Thermoleophilia bacterium]
MLQPSGPNARREPFAHEVQRICAAARCLLADVCDQRSSESRAEHCTPVMLVDCFWEIARAGVGFIGPLREGESPGDVTDGKDRVEWLIW